MTESGRRRAAGDRNGARGRGARHKPGCIRRWLANFSRASPEPAIEDLAERFQERPCGKGLAGKATDEKRCGAPVRSRRILFAQQSRATPFLSHRPRRIISPRRGRIPAPSFSSNRPRCARDARAAGAGCSALSGVEPRTEPRRRFSGPLDLPHTWNTRTRRDVCFGPPHGIAYAI